MNIEKIKNISNFFEKRYKNNDIYCETCHIEHTGRNAYTIGIWLYLFDETKDKKYFDMAYGLVKTTMSKLQEDPIHNKLVFMPGRHSLNNQTSTVIESGICLDMISHFLYTCDNLNINIEEKSFWQIKLNNHITEYLTNATLTKDALNQRLWGLTGIATFYKLTKDKNIKEHIILAIDNIIQYQDKDGLFPYVANRESSQVEGQYSQYYQSRLLTYMIYCLECIDELDKYNNILFNGIKPIIDINIIGGGIKPLGLETKRWFFNTYYEIDSSAFDYYIINFLQEYKKVDFNILESIEKNINNLIFEDGLKQNLNDIPNYMCRFIENSDLFWITRVNKIVNNDKKLLNKDLTSTKYYNILKDNESICLITLSKGMNTNFYHGLINNLLIAYVDEKYRYILDISKLYKIVLSYPKVKKVSFKTIKKDIINLRHILQGFKYNLKYKKSLVFKIILNFLIGLFFEFNDNTKIEEQIKYIKKYGIKQKR